MKGGKDEVEYKMKQLGARLKKQQEDINTDVNKEYLERKKHIPQKQLSNHVIQHMMLNLMCTQKRISQIMLMPIYCS